MKIAPPNFQESEVWSLAFTYLYTFRMRPNRRLLPVYRAHLFIDSDSPFVVHQIALVAYARQDERIYFVKHYSVKVQSKPVDPDAQPALPMMVFPPLRFAAGSMVELLLQDPTCDPIHKNRRKLRMRKNGGRGLTIELALHGVKAFPKSAAQPETSTSTKSSDPTPKNSTPGGHI